MEVTVAIVARDAQRTLKDCLTSVASFASEIVLVVDDRTTDDTVKLADRFRVKTVLHRFSDFSSQRNYAASLTANRWLLSLDADETVSRELAAAIQALPDKPIFAAYVIPRKNIIFKKTINFSNWDPNGLVRLYDKTRCTWTGQVHEQLAVEGGVGRLYDPIIHQNYFTVEQFLHKQNYYSSLEADRRSFSWFNFIFSPISDFFRRYLIHTGFLDGWHGLFLSYLMVIFHLSVWVKAWQKSNQIQN